MTFIIFPGKYLTNGQNLETVVIYVKRKDINCCFIFLIFLYKKKRKTWANRKELLKLPHFWIIFKVIWIHWLLLFIITLIKKVILFFSASINTWWRKRREVFIGSRFVDYIPIFILKIFLDLNRIIYFTLIYWNTESLAIRFG